MSEKCTKTSSPPPSGLINPKSLASLNQLPFPVAAKQIDRQPESESNVEKSEF